ncbi:MAG: VanZ family protein, partial [Paracoccaceae bacterium]
MTRQTGLIVTLTALVFVAVTVATLMPARLEHLVPGNDKLYHFLAFGALVLPTAAVRPRWAIWAVLATIAYGGFIEIIQPYFGRERELADLRADALGAMAAAVAGLVLNRFWLRR